MRSFILLVSGIWLSISCFSQDQHTLDSLQNSLRNTNAEDGKANVLFEIGDLYYYAGISDSAVLYYDRASSAALNNQEVVFAAKMKRYAGISLVENGNYNDGLVKLSEGKAIIDTCSSIDCFTELGGNDLETANVYEDKGDYDKALKLYISSLRNYEKAQYQKGIANCYTGIGEIKRHNKEYDVAIEYYMKAMKVYEENNNNTNAAICMNNMAIAYTEKGNGAAVSDSALAYYQIAMDLYERAIVIFRESGNLFAECSLTNNLAGLAKETGNYELSLQRYLQGLELAREINNANITAPFMGNIGQLYKIIAESPTVDRKKATEYYQKALDYAGEGFLMSQKAGIKEWIAGSADVLKDANTKLGNYAEAIKYAEILIAYRDSMFSEEKTRALTEMEAIYQAEKKQLEIENLNKENALKKAELAQSEEKRNKQLIMIYSFIVGFIIILVFSIIIYRLFLQKKKANYLLQQQKEEIEAKNEQLYMANEEITTQRDEIAAQRDMVTEQKEYIENQKEEIEDSIRYAKRIQTAVLPATTYAESILGEHFILFRPKDVVSGDFYWATQTDEWTIVTAADCTGHGVPGAFMSMLGVSFLNEIVRKKEVTNTAEILNHLRSSVIEALKQTGEEGTQKDGMDMSIVAIHKDRKRGLWAGANNPLWIIRNEIKTNGETDAADLIEEVKGDKMPVAVHINMDDFTNHDIQFNKGDKLYLFSDGYPDQFGGPKGKKYLYKRFKRTLVRTSVLSMEKQGAALEKELESWMNIEGESYEQIDDITVLGLMM